MPTKNQNSAVNERTTNHKKGLPDRRSVDTACQMELEGNTGNLGEWDETRCNEAAALETKGKRRKRWAGALEGAVPTTAWSDLVQAHSLSGALGGERYLAPCPGILARQSTLRNTNGGVHFQTQCDTSLVRSSCLSRFSIHLGICIHLFIHSLTQTIGREEAKCDPDLLDFPGSPCTRPGFCSVPKYLFLLRILTSQTQNTDTTRTVSFARRSRRSVIHKGWHTLGPLSRVGHASLAAVALSPCGVGPRYLLPATAETSTLLPQSG